MYPDDPMLSPRNENVITTHHITADLPNHEGHDTTDAVSLNNSVNPNLYADNDLRVVTLNVCGIHSKLKRPDFIEFISKHDIVGICETKMDQFDQISIDGFTVFSSCRKHCKRSSGGVMFLVKDYLRDFIKPMKLEILSQDTIWIALDKSLLGLTVALGCVYIPPENSIYADIEKFNKLESDILSIKGRYTNICIMGDFNARSGLLSDFIDVDDTIMNESGFDRNLHTDLLGYNNFDDIGVSNKRYSKDLFCNNFGRRLISLCKNTDIHIINGRFGKDFCIGALTCKNSSLVDYIIASPPLFSLLADFEVLEFNEMLSDVHCPIYVSFKKVYVAVETVDSSDIHLQTKPSWHKCNPLEFLQNLDREALDSISRDIDNCYIKGVISKDDINDITDRVSNVLLDSAKLSGAFSRPFTKGNYRRKHKKQPWFNTSCEEKRKLFFQAKANDKVLNNEASKVDRQQASKAYKREINKQFRLFNSKMHKKLRVLKNKDPKEYWKILNGSKSEKKAAHAKLKLDTFTEHFKNLNKIDVEDEDYFDI